MRYERHVVLNSGAVCLVVCTLAGCSVQPRIAWDRFGLSDEVRVWMEREPVPLHFGHDIRDDMMGACMLWYSGWEAVGRSIPDAEQELLAALPQTKGAARHAVLRGLAGLHGTASLPALSEALSGAPNDAIMKQRAVFALMCIGSQSAKGALRTFVDNAKTQGEEYTYAAQILRSWESLAKDRREYHGYLLGAPTPWLRSFDGTYP